MILEKVQIKKFRVNWTDMILPISNLNAFFMRKRILFFILLSFNFLDAQNETVSDTRKFINEATFTQIDRDWNVVAILKSGLEESVTFFPIVITDLKTGTQIKALQIDVNIICKGVNYTRTSWVDFNEIAEFITFIETYVLPNLSKKTERKKSTTYLFQSKEITFRFEKGNLNSLIALHFTPSYETDASCFFWTRNQTDKTPDLLTVLKTFKM